MFSSVVVLEHHIVAISQVDEARERGAFHLWIDGQDRGEIELGPFSTPGIALANGQLAVWGGMSLVLFDIASSAIDQVDLDDEVHAAYMVGDRWCVVCETSVALLDIARRGPVDSYGHDEVILSSWWIGDTLVVEDLQRRRLGFEFREKPTQLPAPRKLNA